MTAFSMNKVSSDPLICGAHPADADTHSTSNEVSSQWTADRHDRRYLMQFQTVAVSNLPNVGVLPLVLR